MDWRLARHPAFAGRPGPVVLVVLDGVGLGAGDAGDAVAAAKTPTLDAIAALGHTQALRAHGTAVGLPSDDDMGNSEVGHNALGAGAVHTQGAALVQQALASGALMQSEAFVTCVRRGVQGGALHFLGLLSDGNVHAHLQHLIAMLRAAAAAGVRRLFVHALLDGRDVAPTSALTYVDALERELAALRAGGCEAAIASGGGRMQITMDRYEADWEMVARGWRTHVHGDARRFASATQAILTLRDETPGVSDQDLPAFAIAKGGAAGDAPIAPMCDGDSVILFNFRGDRAIEISRAFDTAASEPWTPFDRGRVPALFFAGMMQYDGDLQVPRHFLVSPPLIEHTMGEYLARNEIPQLALSETQKFGHVTYFWNGNRSGMFDARYETYVQIDSDRAPFDERPWMKCAEITDALIAGLDAPGAAAPRFVRVNYPNGDMVGHTGAFAATVLGVEAVDLQLARLQHAVRRHRGILVITADHGNADEMYQRDRRGQTLRDANTGAPLAKTSHSLAPVPFMIYDPGYGGEYALAAPRRIWRAAPPQDVAPVGVGAGGLGNVAATCLELLGYQAPATMLPSLLARR